MTSQPKCSNVENCSVIFKVTLVGGFLTKKQCSVGLNTWDNSIGCAGPDS